MYNGKAVKNAAIAQSVERILGKDEVASSNLASSSKRKPIRFGWAFFWIYGAGELATSSVLSALADSISIRGREASMGSRPHGAG